MAVLIRLAREEDAAALAAVYRPYVEGSRISFEEEAPDAVEMATRLRGSVPGMHPWLVAEEEGRLLGYAASSPFRVRKAYRWTVETGVYLAAEAQGRGIGKALMSALLDLLERQGYVAAIAAIAPPNPASIALHEGLGFRRVGTYEGTGFKLGEWMDVGLWQKELTERTNPPPELRPFAQLAGF